MQGMGCSSKRADEAAIGICRQRHGSCSQIALCAKFARFSRQLELCNVLIGIEFQMAVAAAQPGHHCIE